MITDQYPAGLGLEGQALRLLSAKCCGAALMLSVAAPTPGSLMRLPLPPSQCYTLYHTCVPNAAAEGCFLQDTVQLRTMGHGALWSLLKA